MLPPTTCNPYYIYPYSLLNVCNGFLSPICGKWVFLGSGPSGAPAVLAADTQVCEWGFSGHSLLPGSAKNASQVVEEIIHLGLKRGDYVTFY